MITSKSLCFQEYHRIFLNTKHRYVFVIIFFSVRFSFLITFVLTFNEMFVIQNTKLKLYFFQEQNSKHHLSFGCSGV